MRGSALYALAYLLLHSAVAYSINPTQDADTTQVNRLIREAKTAIKVDLNISDSLARTAFDLANRLGYRAGQAGSLIVLSYVNSSQSAYDEGFQLCRQAIEISQALADDRLLCESYNQLYLLYYQKGMYDSATWAAETSMAIARELDYRVMLARGHQNFGILKSIKGDHAGAIAEFFESEKYYMEIKDDFALAMVLGNIGVTFEQAGNYPKALEYMHREFTVSKRINNLNLQAWSMVNIGSMHSQMGLSDSALYYYNRSLELAKQLQNHDLIITNLDNIGSYYSNHGDFKRAKSILRAAYALAEETGFEYQNVYIAGHLAETYLAERNLDSARYYAELQLELASAQDLRYDQKLAYENLATIHARANNYRLAYEVLRNQIAINDSLFNEEKSAQIEGFRERYETEKKEHQIDILRAQKAAADFRRNAYLTGGVLAVLLVGFLYLRFRASSRRKMRLLEREQALEKAKTNFFTNISHEFRTPLTLIAGPVDALRSNLTDERLKTQVDILERNASRLLTLVNQLLDLARLESGIVKLRVTCLDIVTVVKGVTMSFNSLADVRRIKLNVNSSQPSLPAYVDREKIETVLTNLISNSFKFTEDGGRIEVDLSVEKNPQPMCTISVKDTGKGISEKDVSHVFERFYQASSNDGKNPGTGIGLALTKELIELHKGSVDIKSQEGVGTEVRIHLLLGKDHFEDHQLIATDVEESTFVGDGVLNTQVETVLADHHEAAAPVILLIEDNEDLMIYLKSILPYPVLEASDGEQGISVAIEHIPDLVISDVMMPLKNGFEVCDALKNNEKTSHIPIMMLTARASAEDRIHGFKAQADDYLVKPFIPKELLVRVQNLVESRRRLREKFNRQVILKPSDVALQSIDEQFLGKVMAALEANIGNEDFSVEILGREVGMSRSQIHRKLHALTNQSASQFISAFRLNRAMDMIRQNAGTIAEIAYSVGFSSPSYFNRCFLQHFGCTPSEVKRQA